MDNDDLSKLYKMRSKNEELPKKTKFGKLFALIFFRNS